MTDVLRNRTGHHSRWPVRLRLGLLAASLVGGVLGPVPSAVAAADSTVTLIGHGFGHGRGLAQWGAFGYAVDQGWSASTILKHYYGNTTAGQVPNDPIRVRLVGLEATPDTWITSTQGFTAGGVHLAGGSSARVIRDAGAWKLETTAGRCGTGTPGTAQTISANPNVVPDGVPGSDPAKLLTVCATGIGYRGTLSIVDSGGMKVVNTLPVESYLRGVVPRESIASWGDSGGGKGMQALIAQAVASRSYALTENRYSYADTCDTTSCQVYGGAAINGEWREDARTDNAVAASAGQVRRTASGAIAHTEFGSSSGGLTTGDAFPHVQDWGDLRSPYSTWRVDLQGAAITAAYPQIGTFGGVAVSRRDGEGTAGGRALNVVVWGASGQVTVTGDAFRFALGLRSNWFTVMQQATGYRYAKMSYSPTIYQIALNGPLSEHMAMTYADWFNAGLPKPGPAPTELVKYPWAPGIYAVTFWPGDPQWQWDKLTYEQWRATGFQGPRVAGWIYGTSYWRVGTSPDIHAEAPDGAQTVLTYQQWVAAGYPTPEIR